MRTESLALKKAPKMQKARIRALQQRTHTRSADGLWRSSSLISLRQTVLIPARPR